MNQKQKIIVLLSVLSLSLSACSGKKTESTTDSKPAVKVNGKAISDAEFQLKSGMHDRGDDKKSHPVSEQAMQSMVNMELLRQAAVESKLDADKAVQAKIANAMRSILATAYMEKKLAEVVKPTEADISAYYNQHPERFANRKMLTMQEVAIRAQPGKEAEIRAEAGKAKKAEDLEKWLQANKIEFNRAPISNTTDQIPDEVMQKLKDVTVGGSVIVGGNGMLHVIFVLADQAQPIVLAQASSMISNQLMDKGAKDTMANMIKSLRDKAKIEYVAPYSEKGLPDAVKE